ncbi:hypothetical protein Poly51_34460 [Rubripirellula tenax]|uniref:Uncharacterized protein n=1 Tax=Rubripirellula tenax TaxID=2528015 RepID=A0A5C6F2V6_9BACT|nr:hypothetical protein [Rubripirellula tenax]TWU54727.1 hypothetical protein Poly51_34460 [Rubripirellula tenax]
MTDSGSNETEYFRRVLKKMKHPISGKKLDWTRVADFYHVSERVKVEKSLEADWALRLAGGERIVEVKPTPNDEADWIVRLVSTHSKESPRIERVEIARAGNDVQFRRSEVRHFVPGNLFYFGFDVQTGIGTISNASFGIGGSDWKSSDQRINLEPTLLEALEVPLLAELERRAAGTSVQRRRGVEEARHAIARLSLPEFSASVLFLLPNPAALWIGVFANCERMLSRPTAARSC